MVKICPLYKKAYIEGMTSRFGDNSVVNEYVQHETKNPEIIACDGNKCAAHRSYFHEGERAIVEHCGLAEIERI